ncbi:MAG: YfiR family protein [Bacteroidetes bacterium]|nr:YfiR family protein [Bacteroidota bacterium]
MKDLFGKMLRRMFLRRVLVVLLPVLSFFYAFRSPIATDEYAVKAMFVYNFTKYFDWSHIESKNDFVISVYGNSTINKYLKEISLRKSINGKNIVIKTIYSASEAIGSQIVFIPENESAILSNLVENSELKSVVLIAEEKNGIKKGGHLNLITIDGKMRFELNETALNRDGINFSKDLVVLAIKSY